MALIKRLIRNLIVMPWVWRLLTAKRWRENAVILVYRKVIADTPDSHELTESHFEQHLDWLQRTFEIITLEQFVSLDRNRSFSGKPKALLTFDDAFISMKEKVYPILRRRGLRGLMFVPSEPVSEGDSIWPQVNLDLFWYGKYQSLPSFDANNGTLSPKTPQQRLAAEKQLRQRLKKITSTERRDAMQALKQAAGWDATQLQHDSRLMNWDELRDCADVFSYGCHTHTHPTMSSQTKANQRDDEQTCVERIQMELGVAPLLFAYPNGEQGDFDQDSIAVLREAGYQWAFTTQEGLYERTADPMTIRRLPTWAPTPGDLAWIIFTA